MNFRTITILTTTLSFLLVIPVYAQEKFDLFNPDRGKPPPPPAPKVQAPVVNPFMRPPPKKEEPPPPPPPKPLQPQKDFTLRGTSLIGDKLAVILQGPDGKQFPLYPEKSEKGVKRLELSDYPGFALLNIEARQVTIEYPVDAPCRASIPSKIECSKDQKTAVVKLALLDAIPAPAPFQPQPFQPPAPPPPVSTIPAPPSPQTPPMVMTPFGQVAAPAPLSPDEQRRREEEQKRRAEIYKNFKRQVIKDEDVPPGMRVVHTPFGDRLVPDNK